MVSDFCAGCCCVFILQQPKTFDDFMGAAPFTNRSSEAMSGIVRLPSALTEVQPGDPYWLCQEAEPYPEKPGCLWAYNQKPA